MLDEKSKTLQKHTRAVDWMCLNAVF